MYMYIHMYTYMLIHNTHTNAILYKHTYDGHAGGTPAPASVAPAPPDAPIDAAADL